MYLEDWAELCKALIDARSSVISLLCRHKREKDVKRPKTEAEKIIDIERREAASGKLTRNFKQGQWLAGDAASGFYIDTHADKDNLAFEGLYRMNIAAYHRLDPTKVAAGTQPRTGYAYSVRWALAILCFDGAAHQ